MDQIHSQHVFDLEAVLLVIFMVDVQLARGHNKNRVSMVSGAGSGLCQLTNQSTLGFLTGDP